MIVIRNAVCMCTVIVDVAGSLQTNVSMFPTWGPGHAQVHPRGGLAVVCQDDGSRGGRGPERGHGQADRTLSLLCRVSQVACVSSPVMAPSHLFGVPDVVTTVCSLTFNFTVCRRRFASLTLFLPYLTSGPTWGRGRV